MMLGMEQLFYFPGTLSGVLVLLSFWILRYIINFYENRKHFPPGPFPLPIIGNFIQLKLGKLGKKHRHQVLQEIGQKYQNGIFTIYFGSEIQVIVANPHLALEVLKKHHFAGRGSMTPLSQSLQTIPCTEFHVLPKGSTDLFFSDFNQEFETLRRVSHLAIIKAVQGGNVVADIVDEVVEKIKDEDESSKKVVDIREYLFLTVYSMMAAHSFGSKYSVDDPELNDLIRCLELQNKRYPDFMTIVSIAGAKYLMPSAFKDIQDVMKFQYDLVSKKYQERLKSFDPENVQDFTDIFLSAVDKAKKGNNNDTLQLLNSQNIRNCLQDLFLTGGDGIFRTLDWAFLYLANYPEIQRNIRKEILSNIDSNELPNSDHRTKCSYTMAFIAETLRYRYTVPSGLPHKATVDIQLGSHFIKKGTIVKPIMGLGMHDKDSWKDPEVFRPERFLDEAGNFIPKPNQFFIPFAAGRRSCPGEKLALADMFFIIARFMQQTEGMEFVLPNGPGSADLDGDYSDPSGWFPCDYKVVFKPTQIMDFKRG